jgi:hypothetical protein
MYFHAVKPGCFDPQGRSAEIKNEIPDLLNGQFSRDNPASGIGYTGRAYRPGFNDIFQGHAAGMADFHHGFGTVFMDQRG